MDSRGSRKKGTEFGLSAWTRLCAAAPLLTVMGVKVLRYTNNSRGRMSSAVALTVLTKATPGYAGGEKELIARGGVDKKKSPS